MVRILLIHANVQSKTMLPFSFQLINKIEANWIGCICRKLAISVFIIEAFHTYWKLYFTCSKYQDLKWMQILNYKYFFFKIVNRRKAVDLKTWKSFTIRPSLINKENLHNTLEPPHFPAISPWHRTGEQIRHHFKLLKPLIISIWGWWFLF